VWERERTSSIFKSGGTEASRWRERRLPRVLYKKKAKIQGKRLNFFEGKENALGGKKFPGIRGGCSSFKKISKKKKGFENTKLPLLSEREGKTLVYNSPQSSKARIALGEK